MTDSLPAYSDLPVVDGAPAGSAWGLWGEDDRLGCLNLLTPERVVAAASLIRTGDVFGLDMELDLPDPPLFGRSKLRHTVLGDHDGPGHDDLLDAWNTQSSTQWDGFRHVRNPVHGWYDGAPEDTHSVHYWAEHGLAGAAVLADVGRWRAGVGRPLEVDRPDPIEPDDVLATLDAQGTVVEAGDVLLIRTGWVEWYRSRGVADRTALAGAHENCGLRPGLATAEMLWDLHVAAVAADNPSLEVWPIGSLATPDEVAAVRADRTRQPEVFVHTALLPLLGMPIGELFDLGPLADACATDGRYRVFFTSAPLRLRHGVASPPNAVAIR